MDGSTMITFWGDRKFNLLSSKQMCLVTEDYRWVRFISPFHYAHKQTRRKKIQIFENVLHWGGKSFSIKKKKKEKKTVNKPWCGHEVCYKNLRCVPLPRKGVPRDAWIYSGKMVTCIGDSPLVSPSRLMLSLAFVVQEGHTFEIETQLLCKESWDVWSHEG